MTSLNINALFWGQISRVTTMKTPTSENTPADSHALPYTERELIQKAIRNLPEMVETAHPKPLFQLVRMCFNCASDTARRICWKYGFDPEKIHLKAYNQLINRSFDPSREIDDHK